MAETHSTCRLDGCSKKVDSKGMCQAHYKRFMATGSPQRPCLGCGADLTNFTVGAASYCTEACKPKCRLDYCDSKVYAKHDVCRSHKYVIERNGGEDPKFNFAKEKLCLVCGARDWPTNHLRRYCSKRCAALYARAGGEVLRETICVHCGDVFDLFAVSPVSGRKKRTDSGRCGECRRPRNAVKVEFLVERDGSDCSICKKTVDTSLAWPHRFSASVDHVIPYYEGGENTPGNCALAHLECNVRKNKFLVAS